MELMPKKPENKTHHVHAVVTPEAATPDNFLVSRATRKIFSPFGAPLMCSPYAQEEGLCPKRLMPKEELMPKTGLMPKKTENKPHHVHAVVTPGAPASDHLLVSRATRKILSPFGAPLMYSP